MASSAEVSVRPGRWSSRCYALGALLAGILGTNACRADCVSDAAAYHRVNDSVVRAILWNESRMKGGAINRNTNGSIDVGIGQINSIHFPELRRRGITPEMLTEPCIGTYVAAWHYAKQVAELGNTWEAVGAYHSRTPLFQQSYANGVAATLAMWGIRANGPLPFPNSPKSSGEAQRLVKQRGGSPNATTTPRIVIERSTGIISLEE